MNNSSGKSGYVPDRRSRTASLSQIVQLQSKKQFTPQEIVFNRLPGWTGDHLIRLEYHEKGEVLFLIRYIKHLDLNISTSFPKSYGL